MSMGILMMIVLIFQKFFMAISAIINVKWFSLKKKTMSQQLNLKF
jgi:hypothetical protein